MSSDLERALDRFVSDHGFRGKGPLCVALVVTQHAREKGLPLDVETLMTPGGGQVLGLGKSAVQAVLGRYGIERVLAAEGGRTSRGSLNNMRLYAAFLNELNRIGSVDMDAVESCWISRVRAFFSSRPFTIKLDASRSLRYVIGDILNQAAKRQEDTPGVTYAGAVLQHLTGAKLDCALRKVRVEHNSYATADAPGGRAGDFLVGDVAIHVTTAPGEAVIERCRETLDRGYRPVLVTVQRSIAVAEGIARNKGLADRVDIFEIEQFLALNLYELGDFESDGRRMAIEELIVRYNKIVAEVETDPSLEIRFRR